MTSSDTCVVRVASLVTGPPLDSCVLSKMNPLLLCRVGHDVPLAEAGRRGLGVLLDRLVPVRLGFNSLRVGDGGAAAAAADLGPEWVPGAPQAVHQAEEVAVEVAARVVSDAPRDGDAVAPCGLPGRAAAQRAVL